MQVSYFLSHLFELSVNNLSLNSRFVEELLKASQILKDSGVKFHSLNFAPEYRKLYPTFHAPDAIHQRVMTKMFLEAMKGHACVFELRTLCVSVCVCVNCCLQCWSNLSEL